MGKDYTPRYVCHLHVPGYYLTPAAWEVRGRFGRSGDGKPTNANLKRYIETFEASTQPGGVNKHLGPMKVVSAFIKDQFNGEEVARY